MQGEESHLAGWKISDKISPIPLNFKRLSYKFVQPLVCGQMARGKRQSDGLSSGPVGKRQRANASAHPKQSLIRKLKIPSG